MYAQCQAKLNWTSSDITYKEVKTWICLYIQLCQMHSWKYLSLPIEQKINIYRINRREPDKMCWRCIVARGSESLSTVNNIPGFWRRLRSHRANHIQIVAKQTMNQVIKRCLEEVRSLPNIFTEKLNKLRDYISRDFVKRLPHPWLHRRQVFRHVWIINTHCDPITHYCCKHTWLLCS